MAEATTGSAAFCSRKPILPFFMVATVADLRMHGYLVGVGQALDLGIDLLLPFLHDAVASFGGTLGFLTFAFNQLLLNLLHGL